MCCFFFFHDTATTEIYTYFNTLSLHDALPISWRQWDPVTVIAQNTPRVAYQMDRGCEGPGRRANLRPYNTGAHYPPLGRPSRTAQAGAEDRKSTRLNSSH